MDAAWVSPLINGAFLLVIAFMQRKINAKDVEQANFNKELSEKLDDISEELKVARAGSSEDRTNLLKLQHDIASSMRDTQALNLRILEEMEKITTVQSNLFVMMKVQEKINLRGDD